MNATLPEERRCVTQPRTEAVRPTCSRSASIRTNDDVIDVATVTGVDRPAIFGPGRSQRRVREWITRCAARRAGRGARVFAHADTRALGGRNHRRRAAAGVARYRGPGRVEPADRVIARYAHHLDRPMDLRNRHPQWG